MACRVSAGEVTKLDEGAPRVTVVIPNFNGLAHLPGCLGSLRRQVFAAREVIVVDNASQDGSRDWVSRHHAEATTIALPENGGFAKAVNAGIKAARGEYVALLNNDTVADAHWLLRLVQALDAHPEYDFGASKIVMLSEPGRLNAAGDTYDVARLAGRNRGMGKPAGCFARPQRVLGACAGAAVYRRSLFDDVGLFDEDFFLMSEDTDFNLRCLVAGKRCLYVPDAVVWHKYRASIAQAPATETRLLASRNEVMTAAKNLPLGVLLCPLPWIWRGLRQTVLLRRDHLDLVPVLLRETPARMHAELEGFRLGWRKRPQVWSHQAAGHRVILRWLIKGSGPV